MSILRSFVQGVVSRVFAHVREAHCLADTDTRVTSLRRLASQAWEVPESDVDVLITQTQRIVMVKSRDERFNVEITAPFAEGIDARSQAVRALGLLVLARNSKEQRKPNAGGLPALRTCVACGSRDYGGYQPYLGPPLTLFERFGPPPGATALLDHKLGKGTYRLRYEERPDEHTTCAVHIVPAASVDGAVLGIAVGFMGSTRAHVDSRWMEFATGLQAPPAIAPAASEAAEPGEG